jgi:hypothetical protein
MATHRFKSCADGLLCAVTFSMAQDSAAFDLYAGLGLSIVAGYVVLPCRPEVA